MSECAIFACKIQFDYMKRLYIFLLCIAAAFSVSAQTIREAIKEMPDEVLPLFTKNDRLDFLDYLASHAKAEVKNRMGSMSEMTTLTDDYAHIRTSEVSELSFKLLQKGTEKVICLVSTCQVDSMYDSEIHFYDMKWNLLDTKQFIDIPKTNDYQQLVLSAQSSDLQVVQRRFSLLPEGEKAMHEEPHLTLLKWNGMRFE